MNQPYQIAAEPLIEELVVNKSRFICYLFPCNAKVGAKEFIRSVQALHPQASHHCYAFIVGKPLDSQSYGFSDDGEPSGTAGKPMLAVLQGSNVGEVCAVVARYFGGTKLGTGGLQRAYGGSVRQAMANLITKTKIPMVHKTLACQYNQVNDVLHIIEKFGGKVIGQTYSETIDLILALPIPVVDEIQEQITTMSSGELLLKRFDKSKPI